MTSPNSAEQYQYALPYSYDMFYGVCPYQPAHAHRYEMRPGEPYQPAFPYSLIRLYAVCSYNLENPVVMLANQSCIERDQTARMHAKLGKRWSNMCKKVT